MDRNARRYIIMQHSQIPVNGSQNRGGANLGGCSLRRRFRNARERSIDNATAARREHHLHRSALRLWIKKVFVLLNTYIPIRSEKARAVCGVYARNSSLSHHLVDADHCGVAVDGRAEASCFSGAGVAHHRATRQESVPVGSHRSPCTRNMLEFGDTAAGPGRLNSSRTTFFEAGAGDEMKHSDST